MYTNIYRYAFSTRENIQNASVQKKALRDGILIQMVDGLQTLRGCVPVISQSWFFKVMWLLVEVCGNKSWYLL